MQESDSREFELRKAITKQSAKGKRSINSALAVQKTAERLKGVTVLMFWLVIASLVLAVASTESRWAHELAVMYGEESNALLHQICNGALGLVSLVLFVLRILYASETPLLRHAPLESAHSCTHSPLRYERDSVVQQQNMDPLLFQGPVAIFLWKRPLRCLQFAAEALVLLLHR